MRRSAANAPRRWWLAALLALAGRGVGQLYNHQPAKAALAFLLPPALLFLANAAPVPAVAQALLLACAVAHVWSVADAGAIAASHRHAFIPHRLDTPLAWFAAVVAVRVAEAALLGGFALRVATAPEGSMAPAVASGDRVVVDLTAYAAAAPQRGDIVAFRSPVDDRSRRISRILGLPGETVELRDRRVLVDGRPLRENWSLHRDPDVLWPGTPSPRDHYGPLRLPADGYFVLDDDRDVGFDSRYWDRPVRRDQIEGRAGIYAFSRHPRAGVRWHRIGLPVHRDVRLPADGPAASAAAMDSGPVLGATGAALLLLAALGIALGAPLHELRRNRRLRRAAAAPWTVVAAAPSCTSAAVRAAHAPATVATDPPLVRLGALADLGRPTDARDARRAIDVPLADCLNVVAVARLAADELRPFVDRLDRIERDGRVRDLAVRGLLLWRAAAALQRLARDDDDADGTRAAIGRYEDALAATPVVHAPLRWAAIQNDLGTALQQLGDQTGDPSRHRQAIEAYRRALTQRTCRLAPLDWATTQNNLGNCLRLLGERERGSSELAASVAAYRAALTQRTREADPVGHAMTLNNLGISLRLLGARSGDAAPILAARRLHHDSFAILERLAPSYAPVPAQNFADDEELLRRLGMDRATALAAA